MNQSSLIGRILYSRYQIQQVLGSGGFGDTYLAADLGLPKHPQCVVKHLLPKASHPAVLPIAKKLFDREAETLHELGEASQQIPKLFAHFEDNGEFYLVQEFIDGHDLTQEIVTGQPKPEIYVTKLLTDILSVLEILHSRQIIHRDIKPPNIRRRRGDGKIVLIDFGAVKEISVLGVNSQGQTSLTVAIGSPGYMPSEQANGKPRLSSDIYAVGMIGIQAITGVELDTLKEDQSTGEINWRTSAQVSDKLAEVIDVMIRYDFRQRYQSAKEALQALTHTLVTPTIVLPPSPPPSISPTVPIQPSPPPPVSPTVSTQPPYSSPHHPLPVTEATKVSPPSPPPPSLTPTPKPISLHRRGPLLVGGIIALLGISAGLIYGFIQWQNTPENPPASTQRTPESTSPSATPIPSSSPTGTPAPVTPAATPSHSKKSSPSPTH